MIVSGLLSFGKDLHPARMRNRPKSSLSVTRDILTNFHNMSTPSNQNIWLKIQEFLKKHETKIVLFAGFCLISGISFEFGFLQGQKWQSKPLVIEKGSDIAPVSETQNGGISEAQEASKTATTPSEPTPASSNLKAGSSACAFVGSKNSNKFYLPTCSYAKRVKPENMVCFKSAQEALGQGRTESKCK